MSAADPCALARLHAQCFTTPPPWSVAAFDAQIAAPHSILVTTDAGFALGQALAGEAELLTMAVAPARRRRGHGRDLLDAFMRAARARAARTVFLEVAVDNAAARALYEGAGFVGIGRREGYYRTPDGQALAALVLRRGLDDPARTQRPFSRIG